MARFFASSVQCENARALAPGACRTAFANALAEFTAKAPSYRSRRACFKQFGPCMPWPIGTHSFSEFRPQWVGITLDATSSEPVVLPAVAPGHIPLDFAPQPATKLSPALSASHPVNSERRPEPVATFMTPDSDEGDVGPAPAAAPAGSGFKMIDGVLTYPAPARFQPKAVKRP